MVSNSMICAGERGRKFKKTIYFKKKNCCNEISQARTVVKETLEAPLLATMLMDQATLLVLSVGELDVEVFCILESIPKSATLLTGLQLTPLNWRCIDVIEK